ncbi:bifunctional hydroxymethylpyrimidine kinase/phosphomethylpyrimidine kinase [Stenoxybacter acetivorans]|uniref:bifunctional hydroxymethylpyrimidine kinase/phosphomethylpyrimidine kinase n=1 Tax=Stenoxybacter acetivorans TaxID=422441 RepID=UPI000A8D2B26|nr:bifunctional hydroxymethylpyrimidine kinase/phosphomethylpyrimidine kinase [Stenoxybacter acetivorans]
MIKKVLTIAGSDCSGGAGIQADLKTFSAHGTYGMSVITSVVAENTCTVADIQNIHTDIITKQMDCVFEDIFPEAVKIGMLSTPEIMITVAECLANWLPENIVVDPVMYAKNGCALMKESSVNTLIQRIIPLADVLTPNIPEAEKISGISINHQQDMEQAARIIQQMGAKTVLVKGGHKIGDAIDVLYDGKSFYYFSSARINTKNTHGTGCTYSSAIAANLANGLPILQAITRAKSYITTAIEHALNLGKGNGPTNHFYDLYQHGLQEAS